MHHIAPSTLAFWPCVAFLYNPAFVSNMQPRATYIVLAMYASQLSVIKMNKTMERGEGRVGEVAATIVFWVGGIVVKLHAFRPR